jgi:NAD(P)-dependent dehydrogenase (short-subunit alcohol dehydrogenase family)
MAETNTKTALITGSAKRLGREISLHLASKGWDIAIHYNHSHDEAMSLKAEIEGKVGRAELFSADFTAPEAIDSLMANVNNKVGPVAALINNASLFGRDDLENFSYEAWLSHMQIHHYAPARLSVDFIQQYRKNKSGEKGAIINLVDGCYGWSISPNFLSYSLSKLSLEHSLELLAKMATPDIRVNNIATGPTLPSVHDAPGVFEKIAEQTWLKQTSSPARVCDAVEYLLGAQDVTAQTIALNGKMVV